MDIYIAYSRIQIFKKKLKLLRATSVKLNTLKITVSKEKSDGENYNIFFSIALELQYGVSQNIRAQK